MTAKKFFGHLKTILVHKWWVFYYCCRCGIPWQGFIHDISKFSPVEFWEGVKYYSGTDSPINASKAENGYSKAWLHHKGRNKHHYEYWQDNFDSGTTHLDMPIKYKIEMLCDYLAAGRTYMGKEFTYGKEYGWLLTKLSTHPAMHQNTEIFMKTMIGQLAYQPNKRAVFKQMRKDPQRLDIWFKQFQ